MGGHLLRATAILVLTLTACARTDSDNAGDGSETNNGSETDTQTGEGSETAGASETDEGSETEASEPPELALLFPPGGGTIADSIHVRVAATHASAVDLVRIAGVEASPIADGNEWIAQIPLALGSNAIVVQAESGGALAELELTLHRFAEVGDVDIGSGEPSGAIFMGLEVTADGRHALYGNNFHDDLGRVDLLGSVREGVTGDTSGGGPPGLQLEGPREPVFDPATGLAYLLDPGVSRVAVVDVEARTWEPLADPMTGSGPIDYPNDIELDPPAGRLVVLDRGVNGLYALDPLTGDRTILSGAGTGGGDELTLPMSLALDPIGRQAFVSEQYSSRLRRVDLETGDRSLLLDAEQPGDGPSVEDFDELVWDAAGNRVITWSPASRGLYAIAPETADRTLLSDDALGSGAVPELLVALDGGPGWMLLADERESVQQVWLHAVDPVSGDRVVLHVMASLTE